MLFRSCLVVFVVAKSARTWYDIREILGAGEKREDVPREMPCDMVDVKLVWLKQNAGMTDQTLILGLE